MHEVYCVDIVLNFKSERICGNLFKFKMLTAIKRTTVGNQFRRGTSYISLLLQRIYICNNNYSPLLLPKSNLDRCGTGPAEQTAIKARANNNTKWKRIVMRAYARYNCARDSRAVTLRALSPRWLF